MRKTKALNGCRTALGKCTQIKHKWADNRAPRDPNNMKHMICLKHDNSMLASRVITCYAAQIHSVYVTFSSSDLSMQPFAVFPADMIAS